MRDLAKSLISSRLFVFLATLVAHAGVMLWSRPAISGDGPLYARLADAILRGDWDALFDPARAHWTKSIFLALVAGAKVIAPGEWPVLVTAFNVVCSAATAVLVVSLVRLATGSVVAAWAAFLFYAGSFDVFYGNGNVMTDPLYILFTTAVLVLTARPILTGEPPRSILPLTVCLLVAIFTRPTGIVNLLPVLVAVVAFWPRRSGQGLSVGGRRVLWLVVAAALTAGTLIRTYVAEDPSRWPFDLFRPKVEQLITREKGGEVVLGHASTFRPPTESYSDHLVLAGSRFVRFFQFLCAEFSRRHNWMNALYYGPLYALGMLGVVDAIRTKDRKHREFVLLLLLWVVVFAWFHALTTLLWRYRTPLLPQMIVLAAYGVHALERVFRR